MARKRGREKAQPVEVTILPRRGGMDFANPHHLSLVFILVVALGMVAFLAAGYFLHAVVAAGLIYAGYLYIRKHSPS